MNNFLPKVPPIGTHQVMSEATLVLQVACIYIYICLPVCVHANCSVRWQYELRGGELNRARCAQHSHSGRNWSLLPTKTKTHVDIGMARCVNANGVYCTQYIYIYILNAPLPPWLFYTSSLYKTIQITTTTHTYIHTHKLTDIRRHPAWTPSILLNSVTYILTAVLPKIIPHFSTLYFFFLGPLKESGFIGFTFFFLNKKKRKIHLHFRTRKIRKEVTVVKTNFFYNRCCY